jgi:hypothetical protein
VTLADLAALGSFISGIGVIASLIYLGLQIRQNTLTHRATAYQSRQAFLRDQINLTMDPVLGPVRERVMAGDETLTDAEYGQFMTMQVSWFLGMDHLVWLRDNKVLDRSAFDSENMVLPAHAGRPRCSGDVGAVETAGLAGLSPVGRGPPGEPGTPWPCADGSGVEGRARGGETRRLEPGLKMKPARSPGRDRLRRLILTARRGLPEGSTSASAKGWAAQSRG